jgi:hypothetical protein
VTCLISSRYYDEMEGIDHRRGEYHGTGFSILYFLCSATYATYMGGVATLCYIYLYSFVKSSSQNNENRKE